MALCFVRLCTACLAVALFKLLKGCVHRELWHCCRNIKRYNRYHNHWTGLKQSLEAELKAGAEAKEKLANLEAGKMAGSLSDHTLVVHVSSSSLLHLPYILNHLWESD